MKSKHTPGHWGFQPVAKGGNTRPFDRFDIFSTSASNTDNGYGVETGKRKTFIGVLRAQSSKVTSESNASRVVTCVNGCKKLENPETDVEILLNALQDISSCSQYEAHSIAREALAKVKLFAP